MSEGIIILKAFALKDDVAGMEGATVDPKM